MQAQPPPPDGGPAMPDPVRIAKRTISGLVGMGVSKGYAAREVVSVADRVTGLLRTAGITDLAWVERIKETALAIWRDEIDISGDEDTIDGD